MVRLSLRSNRSARDKAVQLIENGEDFSNSSGTITGSRCRHWNTGWLDSWASQDYIELLENDQIKYVIKSYDTPVAWLTNKSGIKGDYIWVIINKNMMRNWSVATAKHINIINYIVSMFDIRKVGY